jgi:nicotinamidase-related amidase
MARSATVLLLVDFLNFMDFDTAEALAPHAIRAARAAKALKAKLKRSRVPAIYANDNFGHWESDIRAVVQTCIERGGASRTLAELMAPEPGDRSILKPRHSAFFGTPLEFVLDELGAKRLVITGLTTDSCVMFTAHDAYVRGYEVWIPADCVASEKAAYTREALSHMARVLKASVDPSAVPLPKAFSTRGRGSQSAVR